MIVHLVNTTDQLINVGVEKQGEQSKLPQTTIKPKQIRMIQAPEYCGTVCLKLISEQGSDLWKGIVPTNTNKPLEISQENSGKCQVEHEGFQIPGDASGSNISMIIILVIVIVLISCILLYWKLSKK